MPLSEIARVRPCLALSLLLMSFLTFLLSGPSLARADWQEDKDTSYIPQKQWGRSELRHQATAFDMFGKGTIKAHYRFDAAKVDKARNTIAFYYTELAVSRAATPYEDIMQPAGLDNCHILVSELSRGLRFKHIFRRPLSKSGNKVIIIDPDYCQDKGGLK